MAPDPTLHGHDGHACQSRRADGRIRKDGFRRQGWNELCRFTVPNDGEVRIGWHGNRARFLERYERAESSGGEGGLCTSRVSAAVCGEFPERILVRLRSTFGSRLHGEFVDGPRLFHFHRTLGRRWRIASLKLSFHERVNGPHDC